MRETILVTGGCRSGKSRFALRWAEERASKRLFLATALAIDEEMAERIRLHREARGQGWVTVEEPLDLTQALQAHGEQVGVILIDCINIWASNLLLEGLSDEEILIRTGELIKALDRVTCSAALVTNEVGWGIVPDHPLGRRFRDIAGSVNQVLGEAADRVVLMVAGMPLHVK